MKIEGSYRGLTGTPDTIFDRMMSPDMLSKCIPGCKDFREIEADVYECGLSWGYRGVIRVERIAPPLSWKLSVEGKGPVGSVKAVGILELDPRGDASTLVKYKGEFYLGGAAAFLQAGSSLLGSTPYNAIIRSFFETFRKEVEGRSEE
ncbi:MAG: SRPBCC domain-containing protein [Syntrophorhabdales bacterium]